ncbi:response regulator transcription factor [Agaribacterium haliotis]|uniref:response regulator transcription factor n=1 Tax=Agaribacterium haliotis TaxID=2013869 RepID=UPI000BB5428E|nr:response regulator transcription factor [Agaribacterium haliotis]
MSVDALVKPGKCASKLLIVEDDRAILLGLKGSFSKKNYDIQVARDGEQAIQMALSNDFDLILLDVMLPKINGFEVCARIREADINCPLIMLTARGEEEHIVRGLNLGADDYVVKPFSAKQLHARCEASLRRHIRPLQERYDFAAFSLDTRSKQLVHQQRGNISLTPKEYGLLEYLLKKANQAVSREALLDSVWQGNLLTTGRSVDRCVNTLRAKIGDTPKQPRFITSVRNIGYRFNLPLD